MEFNLLINRQSLLSNLQKLLTRLEADLLERSESTDVPDVGKTLRAEYDRAKGAQRTAQNYEDWRTDAITQAAAAWVLSCVFVRFLEDNRLIDPPKIAGPTALSHSSLVIGHLDSGRTPITNDKGPMTNDNRLKRARDEHEIYFRAHPTHTDRDYLLAVFDKLAKLPGGREIFGEHNPVRELPNWLSGDAAGELLNFFQQIDADTGTLVHDFTDPPAPGGKGWDTRFLGDLYQDLSEAARKKYALLQTPEFVEEFILDRTLEPALDEFGLVNCPSSFVIGHSQKNKGQRTNDKGQMTNDSFKMIDPACGSGHFLLGAFRRIEERWERQDPSAKCCEVVQRTLDSIYGVDVNPYAVAIARFRLLLAALRTCGVMRLSDAPAFRMNVICGDSLLHAPLRHGGDTAVLPLFESPDVPDFAHTYAAEDLPALRRILKEGQYHAVVANPPYITPKDRALNEAYRERYRTCHMKYSLAVPFLERIFRLAIGGGHSSLVLGHLNSDKGQMTNDKGPNTTGHSSLVLGHLNSDKGQMTNDQGQMTNPAGYTGQITANSFMKREFGKKLIESFFPTVDLTHVIDTSGAYIPGHGTPTVILFGRNRPPVASTLRTVMGIRGEPSTPDDPAHGLVWSAIVDQMDQPGAQNDFVSVGDSQRESFHNHPWSIGGGGASELKERLDGAAVQCLNRMIESIGFLAITGEDDIFVMPRSHARRRHLNVRSFCTGDVIRDWDAAPLEVALFPYDGSNTELNAFVPSSVPQMLRYLWPHRMVVSARNMFGKTIEQHGFHWFEYIQFIRERAGASKLILFAFVATHNHFVLDRGGKVCKQSAPVIKLSHDASEDEHLGLLGLLNSSTGCFWMQQTMHNKGGPGGASSKDEKWHDFFEFSGTRLNDFPVTNSRPVALAKRLDELAQQRQGLLPATVLRSVLPTREHLVTARNAADVTYAQMIAIQEELDWQCYRHYGLIEGNLTLPDVPPVKVGQRAFEVVMARKMKAGELKTEWFEWLRCEPVTELPASWPENYRQLVERRIGLIQSDLNIGLIEQPNSKRRWETEPWESQLERALREWLLGRLEGYFDFDGRMKEGHSSLVIGHLTSDEGQMTNDKGPMTNDKGQGTTGHSSLVIGHLSSDEGQLTNDKGPMTNDKGPMTNDKGQGTTGHSSLVIGHLNSDGGQLTNDKGPMTNDPFPIALISIAKLADRARQDPDFQQVGELYRNDPAFDVQALVAELVAAETVPLLPVLRYKPSGLRKRGEWERTWELQREEDRREAEKGHSSLVIGHLNSDKGQMTNDQGPMTIPVPPKYDTKDFLSTTFWRLRGKLDVPKERWVSFPHCEGPDGTPVIAWAGYDHLQLATAIGQYYQRVKDEFGGSDDPRLVPLLACLIELLPWLKQWHNQVNPEYGVPMGDYFEGFIQDESRQLAKTPAEIKAWTPPARTGRRTRNTI